MMSDFLFNMIASDEYPYIENFHNQEDLNNYFGFKVPLKFEEINQEELNLFVDRWTTENKFSVLEDNIVDYDLEKDVIFRNAVYTLNDKYYRIEYVISYYEPDHIIDGPYEVERIVTKQPIIKYIRKEQDIKMEDRVNHPSHYCTGNIECIDAMTSAYGTEAVKDFCICNAFKYLWRFKYKNKDEDIEKMLWYINKFKELNAKENEERRNK